MEKKELTFSFFIGFILGFLPTLILYLRDDPLASFWSILPGIFFGFLGVIFSILFKKYKKIAIIYLLILIIVYTVFLSTLFILGRGFIGPFH